VACSHLPFVKASLVCPCMNQLLFWPAIYFRLLVHTPHQHAARHWGWTTNNHLISQTVTCGDYSLQVVRLLRGVARNFPCGLWCCSAAWSLTIFFIPSLCYDPASLLCICMCTVFACVFSVAKICRKIYRELRHPIDLLTIFCSLPSCYLVCSM
jgi:hypothetical protein